MPNKNKIIDTAKYFTKSIEKRYVCLVIKKLLMLCLIKASNYLDGFQISFFMKKQVISPDFLESSPFSLLFSLEGDEKI